MKIFSTILLILFCSAALAEEISYEQALEKKENVLVIFGTDWCGACKSLKKDLPKLNLNCDVCVLNAEKRKDLVEKYEIKSYPTSIILKNREVISKKIGYSKKDYKNWLEKNNQGCQCSPNCGPNCKPNCCPK